jgi:hypothetical protein
MPTPIGIRAADGATKAGPAAAATDGMPRGAAAGARLATGMTVTGGTAAGPKFEAKGAVSTETAAGTGTGPVAETWPGAGRVLKPMLPTETDAMESVERAGEVCSSSARADLQPRSDGVGVRGSRGVMALGADETARVARAGIPTVCSAMSKRSTSASGRAHLLRRHDQIRELGAECLGRLWQNESSTLPHPPTWGTTHASVCPTCARRPRSCLSLPFQLIS